jgi:hypothetical protein
MGISLNVRIDGARETLAAFRKLGKDATKELKDANQQISKDLAGKIQNAARSAGSQSTAVAPSIKAKRDRIPSITAGGNRLATKQRRRSRGQGKTTAGDLVFGANFGSTYLKQFHRKHSGAGDDDAWFFSTVKHHEADMVKEWTDAADKLLTEWGQGG